MTAFRFDLQAVAAAMLQGAGDAVVVCDNDGIIRFWNAGAVRIFGFETAEALGQSLDIIIPERLRKRHWDGYHRMMKTGESRYSGGDMLSVPALRKDGAQISVEFTLAALRNAEGQVIALVAVMRDVTARFQEIKTLRAQLREHQLRDQQTASSRSGPRSAR
jgi:PAS domain S-box-containing protein